MSFNTINKYIYYYTWYLWNVKTFIFKYMYIKSLHSESTNTYDYSKFECIFSPLMERPFKEIKNGLKTIEGRVGKLGSYNDYIGKVVKVRSRNDEVLCKIEGIIHYATLREYCEGEKVESISPTLHTPEEAEKLYLSLTMNGRKDGRKNEKLVFSEERISKKGGINAIHLSLVK